MLATIRRLPLVARAAIILVAIGAAIACGVIASRRIQDAQREDDARATYVTAKCLVTAVHPEGAAPRWDVTFSEGTKIFHATIEGAPGTPATAHEVGKAYPCLHPPSQPALALFELPASSVPSRIVPLFGALAFLALAALVVASFRTPRGGP